MSQSSDTDAGPEDFGGFPDLTAGEYVLGVLDAAESAMARRRIATEPAFAAEVAAWEERLTPLIEHVAAVRPRASVWDAIARQLAPVRRADAVTSRAGFWDNLIVWRGLAFASTALAAASIAIVVGLERPKPAPAPAAPPPLAVAQLERPNNGGVAYVATLDRARGQLVVTPTGRPVPADRSAEVWLMPANAPPRSLGVVMGGSLVARIPAGLVADSTLGVSLETLGGSTTGAPQGPVIAVGKLMTL